MYNVFDFGLKKIEAKQKPEWQIEFGCQFFFFFLFYNIFNGSHTEKANRNADQANPVKRSSQRSRQINGYIFNNVNEKAKLLKLCSLLCLKKGNWTLSIASCFISWMKRPRCDDIPQIEINSVMRLWYKDEWENNYRY